MSPESMRAILPAVLIALFVMECLAVAINLLALAVDLPPTKIEIGHGTRVLKTIGALGAAWFFWEAYKYIGHL